MLNLVLAVLWADPRQQIREALYVPDPLPALAVETHGRFEPEAGIVAERVSYTTQHGMRVPAIVYRPARSTGKSPGLIIVNGHGGDKYSWYAFYSGVAYARAGAVVVTYDPAGEGERNPERKSGTRFHDRVEEPEAIARQLGGLMITDVRQAVSYLASRSDVDPRRIAAAGYSMGSFVLSLACAVETRLKACVLTGGGNLDGEGGYWDRSKPMCQGRPYQALRFLGDRAAQIYALHAARGATLIYNGAEDSVVNIPAHGPEFFAGLRRRVIALRGSDDRVFEYRLLEGASHRPLFVTRPAAEWLHRQLDFPRWSAVEGETHISEWAAAGGVEMDKLYATEHREGGTMAIGVGVPALSRTQLSVLTEEAWSRRQADFSHEQWLQKARRSPRPEPRIEGSKLFFQ